MIRSRQSIRAAVVRGDLGIDPFNEANVKEASYTLTLAPMLRLLQKTTELHVGHAPAYTETPIPSEGYVLQPNQFVLAYTKERIALKGKYACTLSARGSCAQVGLNILLGSTFAEPDTDSALVLEIANVSGMPIRLMAGMKVVKGIFTDVV